MIQFPQDFFWGAATSAYQLEGNNLNSDWWHWEKRAGLKEVSGEACRHYQLYKEDFALAQRLNHNALRLSIEWSRIEPKQGNFSLQELGHYQQVIASLRKAGLEPVVTLNHFTLPYWLAALGGWQNKNAIRYFLRYVEKIVEVLSSQVNYWVTINEPLIYVYYAYILGVWPPQKKSFLKAAMVADNLETSHIQAYRLIRSIYKRKKLPLPLVSIAKNMQAFVPCNTDFRNKVAVYLRDRLFNFCFLERLIRHKSVDFIGINYYSRSLVETTGWGLRNLLVEVCKENHHPLPKNSLGWDSYPQGLYELLVRLKKYSLPVFILENGICVEDDSLRWNFIFSHLENIYLAMQQGVKVLGYLYWSLIDNYEWDKGFSPKFGLAAVDYQTFKRTIRESAWKFAEVCKTGRLCS